MTEIWDAYLPDGRRTDQLLYRDQPIPPGLYHLVVEAMICHIDGSLLLVQRSATKASFAGYWECSTGGSALAGEIAEQAIRRETLEETGLTLEDLTLYDTYLDDTYQCYFQIFQATTSCDKNAVSLQPAETTAYRWLAPADLPDFISKHHLIPSHKSRLTRLFLDEQAES